MPNEGMLEYYNLLFYCCRTPGDYNPSSPSVGSVSPGVNDTSASEEFTTRTPSNTLDSSVTNARQNFYARNFGMVS